MAKDLDEINKFCSKLSEEQIQAMSDDEIMALAMERPGHAGQFGFMLSPDYFYSKQHLADTMSALMLRLGQVKKQS